MHHTSPLTSIRYPAVALFALFCLAFTQSGCTSIPQKEEEPRLYAESSKWLETSLYFAVRRIGSAPNFTGISEERWLQFLDEEVTPRFPAGFTVLDGYGQWMHMKNPNKTPNRLASKIIILLHPDSAEADQKIEAIRKTFTKTFNQESVLRATQAAAVSF